MRIILIIFLAVVSYGCSQKPSSATYSVTYNKSPLTTSIVLNSRNLRGTIEPMEFCHKETLNFSSLISFSFDCDFTENESNFLSDRLSDLLLPLFKVLVANKRTEWVGNYNWCIYVVGWEKWFDVSTKTDSCNSFYVSISAISQSDTTKHFGIEQTISNEKIIQLIADIVHEGFHIHTLKTERVEKLDKFKNEFQAYLLNKYVELYAKSTFGMSFKYVDRNILESDREHLLEHCQTIEDINKLFELNKGRESFIAYVAVNQLIKDIGHESSILSLYLDFVWEYLSRVDISKQEVFSLIESCNPVRSFMIEALSSSFINYDFLDRELIFPTTNYFLANIYSPDESGNTYNLSTAECNYLEQEYFPYLTCLANLIDVIEAYRLIVDNAEYLLRDIPEVLLPRVAHILIEERAIKQTNRIKLKQEYFSFEMGKRLYINKKGAVADTGSALNVNLKRNCLITDEKNTARTVNLFRNTSTFYFCGYTDEYGGVWSNDGFKEKIIGLHVMVKAGNRFIQPNLVGSDLKVKTPFTVQGGLPVFQILNEKGILLNACLDSGSVGSYRAARYNNSIQLNNGKLNLNLSEGGVFPPISMQLLPQSQDNLFHCDLILGTDFMMNFPLIEIGEGWLEFTFASGL